MNGVLHVPRAKVGDDDVSQTAGTGMGIAGVVLKTAMGRLYRLDVVNVSATVAYFVMVFDKASAPANGDTPIWRRRLPVSGEVSIPWEMFGLGCKTGIAIAISTTDATLTLAASNDADFATQWK